MFDFSCTCVLVFWYFSNPLNQNAFIFVLFLGILFQNEFETKKQLRYKCARPSYLNNGYVAEIVNRTMMNHWNGSVIFEFNIGADSGQPVTESSLTRIILIEYIGSRKKGYKINWKTTTLQRLERQNKKTHTQKLASNSLTCVMTSFHLHFSAVLRFVAPIGMGSSMHWNIENRRRYCLLAINLLQARSILM